MGHNLREQVQGRIEEDATIGGKFGGNLSTFVRVADSIHLIGQQAASRLHQIAAQTTAASHTGRCRCLIIGT